MITGQYNRQEIEALLAKKETATDDEIAVVKCYILDNGKQDGPSLIATAAFMNWIRNNREAIERFHRERTHAYFNEANR